MGRAKREEGREKGRGRTGEEILKGWGRGKEEREGGGRGGRGRDARREQWTNGSQTFVN